MRPFKPRRLQVFRASNRARNCVLRARLSLLPAGEVLALLPYNFLSANSLIKEEVMREDIFFRLKHALLYYGGIFIDTSKLKPKEKEEEEGDVIFAFFFFSRYICYYYYCKVCTVVLLSIFHIPIIAAPFFITHHNRRPTPCKRPFLLHNCYYMRLLLLLLFSLFYAYYNIITTFKTYNNNKNNFQ